MDLICYTYDGWEPRIRPASPKRDWMEGTPERFAYRCLPLAIANAHGWEMLSPCGFEARWNGGPGTDAVEIRLDPGTAPRQAPVSLFGQGTLTFHVEGLLRTPAGWNLWVGGSPNAAKDGIAPLGGVIETDWSPYTFTMNWRFTRKNHWVRFEENEPFCFFFPIERGAPGRFEPSIRPIEEEPGLKQAFDAWSKSRDDFQRWVTQTKPSAPADKWQKLYYRGIRPDGDDGPSDHDSKLRLEPFRLPDGSAMAPAQGPAPKPPPAQPASIFASPPHNRAPTQVSDLGLHMALQRLDFGAGPQMPRQDATLFRPGQEAETAPVPGASEPAPVPGASEPAPVPGVSQRRRDWILDVQERQRALSPRAGGVPRVRGLSSQDFLDFHYAPGRPVVIEGELDEWPALAHWTPDFLRKAVGDARVEFQGDRETSPDFELYKDAHRKLLPFGDYLDLIARGPANHAYITAYNSTANASALAPLQADLGRLDKYLGPAPGMMWIGPAGTFTPLHFDLTNNLLAQIVGRKRVILLPPSESSRLHHGRHVFSPVHDVTDQARLALYPSARDARRFEVDLGPGDLLFIPVGWWHQVRAHEFSVMLTYTDFLWPNDASETWPADQG